MEYTKKIRSLKNGELRQLTKEIHKISNSRTPANIKKSDLLTELFNLSGGGFWADTFSNLKRIIESEIMYRISIDEF